MSYDTIKDRNQGRQHECAAAGCGKMVSRKLLMCAFHWHQVPKALQNNVWATWRNGGAGAYLAARQAAIDSVAGGQS